MGRKFNSKDEDFMSCYNTVSSRPKALSSGLGSNAATCNETCWSMSFTFDLIAFNLHFRILGICYNIRYFERHGRDLEDPWSCRQSAIHHSFWPGSKQSTSVIIQPPETFNVITHYTSHALSLHARYLTAGLVNWREYLDTFAQVFKMLVE